MNEPFRQGSEHTIEGIIRDRVDGVLTPLDLTGATVTIKAKIHDQDTGLLGAVKSFSATPDPDQSANKGKYSYQLETTDLDVAGTVYLAAHVTSGGKLHKSLVVDRLIQEALV